MKREDFLGAWHLQSWSISLNDKTTHPFGEDAEGLLLYTGDGYMSALINAAQRPPVGSGSMRHLSAEKKAALFDRCFSYAGTWRLYAQGVVHEVRQAHNPNFVGTEQFRQASLQDDALILSASEEVPGKALRLHKLIWKRPG